MALRNLRVACQKRRQRLLMCETHNGKNKNRDKTITVSVPGTVVIVLVTVFFLVVHLHLNHLVTTFELSHILTNTLNNIFSLLI